jgi:tetratricopeptide (TPR) repeat protein
VSDRRTKLEKLLQADPTDTFVLYALAQEHGKAGDHAQAIDLYDRLLAADPNYFYAYFFKARSLAELNRLDDAKAVVANGLKRATVAGDAKASNELASLQMELDLR